MSSQRVYTISGKEDGIRISSRELEERLQQAVESGERLIRVEAYGQHGIGGRLWKAGKDRVTVIIEGPTGQRAGAMGFPNTVIEIMTGASDDVGWLNAGAEIVVHGHAGNGLANAMAQGRIYVAGSIGARGMTMTKSNPRFDPPEIWVLGSTGDYFGEFMAGGTAVVCGYEAQTPENVLGYRPLVGMVGGRVLFRGAHQGYSTADAQMCEISDPEWDWLSGSLKTYLARIGRAGLWEELSVRSEWRLLAARSSREKGKGFQRSMAAFRADVWDRELGAGGLIGDLTTAETAPIPLVTTGEMRRYVPVWENGTYLAPCQAACPTGIPVQERWRMIRSGSTDEAVELALSYTPFPASVCGYLCPHLCMEGCTRRFSRMKPVDVSLLGRESIAAGTPEIPPPSGKKVAVVGGGPAGLSVAWQIILNGHEATVYDTEERLGGKMASVIPESRIPREVLEKELDRIREVVRSVHLTRAVTKEKIARLKETHDYIVLATGAWQPRRLGVPGEERAVDVIDFLASAKRGETRPGGKVVIIGAGNVGCDAATEAHRAGAEQITLIDVQRPASFGAERAQAEAAGAVFRWPCFTGEIDGGGVRLTSGEYLPADTVVIAIGEAPAAGFLPEGIETENGFVKVDPVYQTSDPQIFAVGDMVRPGLLTDAIGAGRTAALEIVSRLSGEESGRGVQVMAQKPVIDKNRISLAYFDPRLTEFTSSSQCGAQCASCGTCRDCAVCVEICPAGAIRREETEDTTGFAYVVDDTCCIGCGFCAGACPAGIWCLKENEPRDP